MITGVKNLAKDFLETFGVETNQKVVVFCSDDWGGVRVKSKVSRDSLEKAGIDMSANRFDKFDTLESNDDLERLFDTLLKYKDKDGNNPVLTAVMNVANPDFDKIRASDFQEYFYEPFTQTLKRYPNHDKVFQFITRAIENKIFVPESHGREHLQINWWLRELRQETKNNYVHRAFDNEFFMLDGRYLIDSRFRGLGAAFDIAEESELQEQREIVSDGLKLFEGIFGYRSSYFTPPALHYNSHLEGTLRDNFVSWIDVARLRNMPVRAGKSNLKFHYFSQQNSLGQRYLVRNSVFESNLENCGDGVDQCMSGIEKAFKNRKPAIISNHRASFVGGISEKNSVDGIKALDKLISAILRKWPDTVFTSVRDLKNYITFK